MTIGHGVQAKTEFLPFGAAPHVVPREEYVFDPVTGGWHEPQMPSTAQNPALHRAGSPPINPIPRIAPGSMLSVSPGKVPRSREKTIESKAQGTIHYGEYKLDQAKEVSLGILPPDWSVTSSMSDTRPNGRAQFDARFIEAPVGRARGGRSMEWTPVGTADAGATQKAKDLDYAMRKAKEVDDLGIKTDVESLIMWDAVKARDREMTDGNNAAMYEHDGFIESSGAAKTQIYGLKPGEGYEIADDVKYKAGFGRSTNTQGVANVMFGKVGKQELFHGH